MPLPPQAQFAFFLFCAWRSPCEGTPEVPVGAYGAQQRSAIRRELNQQNMKGAARSCFRSIAQGRHSWFVNSFDGVVDLVLLLSPKSVQLIFKTDP